MDNEAYLDSGFSAAPPPFVSLTPFFPSTRRLSCTIVKPIRAVTTAPPFSWVSLQGRLINADEVSSARAIKGGLLPDEATAWELFSPLQRVLIVAVIGAAVARSKIEKDAQISRLQKSVEVTDDSEPVKENENVLKVEKAAKIAKKEEVYLTPPTISQPSSSLSQTVPTDHPQLSTSQDKLDQFFASQQRIEKRMDATEAMIKEMDTKLDLLIQLWSKGDKEKENESSEMVSDAHHTTVTQLKKDVVILKQKVTNFEGLHRSSFSSSESPSVQIPHLIDNPLYDMDSITSHSSQDSDSSPMDRVQSPIVKILEDSSQSFESHSMRKLKSRVVKNLENSAQSSESHLARKLKPPNVKTPEDNAQNSKSHSISKLKSMPPSGSMMRPKHLKSQSVSPFTKNMSVNHESKTTYSTRKRQLSACENFKRSRKLNLCAHKDAPPEKRWVP